MPFARELDAKLHSRRTSQSAAATLQQATSPDRQPDVVRTVEAVSAMAARMALHPVFCAMVGPAPEVMVRKSDMTPDKAVITFSGRAAMFTVSMPIPPATARPDTWPGSRLQLLLMIIVDGNLGREIGCGQFYAGETQVQGTLDDLDAFIVDAEDMIGEFLADAVSTRTGAALLEGAGFDLGDYLSALDPGGRSPGDWQPPAPSEEPETTAEPGSMPLLRTEPVADPLPVHPGAFPAPAAAGRGNWLSRLAGRRPARTA